MVLQGLEILKTTWITEGAVGADPLQGDGAEHPGQIPDTLYREEMAKRGVTLPQAGGDTAWASSLPKNLACEEEIERAVRAEGQVVLGWRDIAHRPGDR